MTKEEKLIKAAKNGNLQKIKYLIKHEVNIHVNDDEVF